MMIIYTPDRAEKLARSFEAMSGFTVQRIIEDQPIASFRSHGSMRIVSRVYARVYKRGNHRCDITYETIDEGSVIW
jgi:hypothetical protein